MEIGREGSHIRAESLDVHVLQSPLFLKLFLYLSSFSVYLSVISYSFLNVSVYLPHRLPICQFVC